MIDCAVSILLNDHANIFFMCIMEDAYFALQLYQKGRLATWALKQQYRNKGLHKMERAATIIRQILAYEPLPLHVLKLNNSSTALQQKAETDASKIEFAIGLSHSVLGTLKNTSPTKMSLLKKLRLGGNEFYETLKKTNWDPIEMTLLFSSYAPLSHVDMVIMLRTFGLIKLFFPKIPLWATLSYICASIGILDQKYYGGFGAASLKTIAPYAARLGWYLTKTSAKASVWIIARLVRSLIYGLGKSSQLLFQILKASRKVKSVEKSPKTALTIARLSPTASTSAILRKAGSQPNKYLTPRELVKYRKMSQIVQKSVSVYSTAHSRSA